MRRQSPGRLTSQYLQEVCLWLNEIEQEISSADPSPLGDSRDSVQELHEAIGAAQVAIGRILAERRLLV